MTTSGRFGFLDVELAPTVAHDGTGQILARRVRERAAGSGFTFVDLVEVPPGTSIGLHRHGADEEAYVVVSGHGRMTVDNQSFDVVAGDVVVNEPGGVHGLVNDGPEPVRLVVLEVAVLT